MLVSRHFLKHHSPMKPFHSAISRRRFLRRSATAIGAAIVAPTIIPASALGRGGARAPSERITMGFIGVGGQGSGHLLGGAWTYVPGGYSALTLMSDPARKPLTVGITSYVTAYVQHWNQLFAAAVIAIVPVVVLFALIERYLVGGLTAGSVK